MGIDQESLAECVQRMYEGEFKDPKDPEEKACPAEDKIAMKLV